MIATVVIIAITLLNVIVYKLRQIQEVNIAQEVNIPLPSQSEQPFRRFSLAEIHWATDNFGDALVIGEGGFGKVYKGFIDNGATTVAIKRLNPMSTQGATEFWTEVKMLSKFRHSHIVSLIGYCDSLNEMILIYEYMAYGSLADHLHQTGKNGGNNYTLSWVERLRICIGAARGLEYLHSGTAIKPRIIHRDVKTANILLDENWAAKISDFGLSKLGPANHSFTHVSTGVKGTYGYLDPEYLFTRRLTRKSDVYGFGVILCEVLCGRKAVDFSHPEEQQSLAVWTKYCIKEGTLDQIIDPILMEQISADSLKVFEQIADQCLHISPRKRPTMAEIVISLTNALTLQEKTGSFILDSHILNANGAYGNDERTDSFMFDSQILNAGGPFVNEEQADSSMEQQVVINSGRSGHNDGEELHIPFVLQSEQLCHRFSLTDIQSATHNFDDALVIGKGGFGKVYKGVIDNGATTVAIKRLNPTSKQGAPEFWTEIKMLSRIRHSHIISLIGYCYNQKEMILIYENMVHGTLAENVHKMGRNPNNSTLSWVQRLKICIGAARGLDYLHTGMGVEKRVIHRDVKSANILLNEKWAAKISDFGLSRTGPADQPCTSVTTKFKGSSGYADFDYFMTNRLTRKVDVYAFGVVLFEVLCGRQALDQKLDIEQRLLAGWAPQCIKEGTLDQIIDPILREQIFPDSLKVFEQIAGQCLHNLSKERPTMAEVVVLLERALALQMRSEFSMLEKYFNTGGALDKQDNASTFLEQQKVIKSDSCNGGHGEVKHARTMTFARKVRQFFLGTSQVTSDKNQGKNFQSHNTNILGPSQENSNNRKRKGKDTATLKRLSKRNDGEQLQVTDNRNGQPMEDTLKRKVNDKSLVTQGTLDILTLPLITDEHSGRVKGIGKGVAPTTYFYLSRRGLKERISELESRLREEEEKNKEKDRAIEALMAQLMKFQSGSLTSPLAEKVASNTHKNDKRRYTELPSNISGSRDSHSKIKNEKFKDNGTRQSQILSLNPKSIWKKEKNQDYGGKKGAIMAFASMLDTIMTTDAVKIPVNIFGDNLDATYIPKNELVRFCKMEALDIVCIISYMRCLYDNFVSSQKAIQFVNPLSAHETFSKKNLNQLMMDRLQSATENQIFFIPFNPGYHWVLVVIDCTTMNVFWVDSLHGEPSSDFKLYINTELELVVKGKSRPPPTWELIKGPFQPGNVECGFYVLKFMKDLMEDPSKSIKIKMEELVGKATYESHEIDEVRHEFIEFIKKYIM